MGRTGELVEGGDGTLSMEIELLGRKRTSVGKVGSPLFMVTWADAVFPMQKRAVSVQIQLFSLSQSAE
jgi:hypothetical protein